jgi:hypothetical protein
VIRIVDRRCSTGSATVPPSPAWRCGATNLIKEGALDGRADLGNIIGNPLETTYFLSRMIFDGTLDEFPGLRLCAAHAGGYLPSYPGRTEVRRVSGRCPDACMLFHHTRSSST